MKAKIEYLKQPDWWLFNFHIADHIKERLFCKVELRQVSLTWNINNWTQVAYLNKVIYFFINGTPIMRINRGDL
jgi:hypothetical protein